MKAGDTNILVDAGGVVMRMMAAGVRPDDLDGVIITHMHSDHVCALNDVITTHWVRTRELKPLKIWDRSAVLALSNGPSHLEDDIGYRTDHHDPLVNGPQIEVIELEPGDAFAINDVQVTAAETAHAPVHPTIGFRLEHVGAVAALVGDTLPCAGVDKLAAAADVYVQSVLRRDFVELLSGEMAQDILEYHSSVVDAAQTATRVGVQRLAMTHMVPAPRPGQYPEWIGAAEHFDSEIIIGDDLTTIAV